ncbi:TasA family protein [Oryzihumus leptocrescens]|uniref:Camelysin-like metallo-endopeptidase n=1 Tax=Oryzihumus leptocrescens TaxID=297536 RepID=A0A542ZEI6_9MICO|nr:TasA family protein [Oryzihumus leptocrescens]TQL58753.1 camelysin-like metallo-endopeptidase [Oryzihumus leptocrescens]
MNRTLPRRVAAVALAITTVGTFGVLTTNALLTTSTGTTAHFEAGTIDLTTDAPTSIFNVGAMVPGDAVFKSIHVTNSGSAQLRYAVTSKATGMVTSSSIAGNLTVQAFSGVGSCDSTGVNTGGAAAGSLTKFVIPTGTATIFGDPTPGAQAGDRVLGPGQSEDICLEVALPASTPAIYGDAATTDINFGFYGEQTANNP